MNISYIAVSSANCSDKQIWKDG